MSLLPQLPRPLPGLLIGVCVILSPISAPDAEAQYLPLGPDYEWTYLADSGARETQAVTGQIPLFGGTPWVVESLGDGPNDGLENFWTSSLDGDVFLWGFYIPGEFGLAYDPPILFVDGPLEVGRAWTQTVDLYSYPDLVYQETFEIGFEVYEEAVLDLPLGELHSFAIGQSAPGGPTPLQGRTLSGRVAYAGAAGSVWDWFSFGVGRVQYHSGEVYRLESYGAPVPIEAMSWGRIKGTFSERSADPVGGR